MNNNPKACKPRYSEDSERKNTQLRSNPPPLTKIRRHVLSRSLLQAQNRARGQADFRPHYMITRQSSKIRPLPSSGAHSDVLTYALLIKRSRALGSHTHTHTLSLSLSHFSICASLSRALEGLAVFCRLLRGLGFVPVQEFADIEFSRVLLCAVKPNPKPSNQPSLSLTGAQTNPKPLNQP